MAVYRNDVDALASRHASLESELAVKTREVAHAAQLLAEAQAKAKRAVLENIRVASPCPMKWADMTGDQRVRACASCDKNVYNLSDLTREEAEALIVEKEGKLCVRYFQRTDGTILLKDCSIGVRAKRKRRVIAAGVALLLGGTALFAFRASRTPKSEPTVGCKLPPAEEYVEVGRSRLPSAEDPPPPEVVPPVEHIDEIMGQAPAVHETAGMVMIDD